jgi:hypothetical protein
VGGEHVSIRPILSAANATPSSVRPSAALSYSFVIARDSALTDVIATSSLVPENPSGTTSWQVRTELAHDSTYYWGAAAFDGSFTGPLSASRTFVPDSTQRPVGVDLAAFAAEGEVGAVAVSWAGPDPADRFRVYRSEAEAGPYVALGPTFTGDDSYTFRDVRLVVGRTYYYRLERTVAGGWSRLYGPLRAQALAPERFALVGAAPNPFNPSATISFEVPRPLPMKLVVYNALGQRVRTLVDGALEPGVHRVAWNGLDDIGREVASGVYLVRMEAPGFEKTLRVTMVR